MAFEDHIEILLDEALEATFPASDPVALRLAAQRWRADGEQPMTDYAHALAPRFRYVPAAATEVGATWRRFGFDSRANEKRRARLKQGIADEAACGAFASRAPSHRRNRKERSMKPSDVALFSRPTGLRAEASRQLCRALNPLPWAHDPNFNAPPQ